MRSLVVVGNGAAGASAAFVARARDPQAQITVVGGEDVPFYSRPGLAYLLTGSIPERLLFSRPDRLYEEARIRRLVATVAAVEPAEHVLRLADGRTVPFDRLLLATGSRATLPDIPGIGLPGVATLDSLAGTRELIRLAGKARRACVVGGGITALELAEGLASRGVEVHYLMRGDRYWSTVLDPAESARVEHHLAADGIRIRTGVALASVVEHKGRVAGVRTEAGETIACDILGVAIGVLPQTGLAAAAGIPVGRGVLVSDAFETELPDILAAGDCAEALDPATGRRTIDTLWSVANEHGRVAGENLAGGSARYTRPAPFNVTRIGGITTTIIGQVGTGGRDADLVSLSRGDSFAWREQLGDFAVAEAAGDSRVRLVLGADRIAGAIVMGDQALSLPLQHLVRDRVDISDVRDRLLDGTADLRTVLASLTAAPPAAVPA